MKKHFKLIKIVSVLILAALAVGCAEYHSALVDPSETQSEAEEESTTSTDDPADKKDDDFTVMLSYGGQMYVPKSGTVAKWSDGNSVHEAAFGEDGMARISGLDGDYQVTLSSLPKGYTYNPNIYVATNDSRNVVIELYKYKTSKRGGDGLYNCISVTEIGVYRTELSSASQVVYYEFIPKQSGTYTIESWVDITANIVNPQYDKYNGTGAAKFFIDTIDTGGAQSTYTKNFKYTIEVDEELIGNIYTFGVKVLSNDANFPVTLDFAIQLNGGFEYDWGSSDLIIPTEIDNINWDKVNVLKTGNTFVGAEKKLSNGKLLFDEDDYGFDEELGCYRKKDPVTGELTGPVLYAYITSACRFYDVPLITIEYAGNKALTVDNGTKNYKLFIEGFSALTGMGGVYFCNSDCICRLRGECNGACHEGCENCKDTCRPCPDGAFGNEGYAGACNSDGVVPVTRELKEFLQKFSISERLYFDGDGWAEANPTLQIDAGEDDQWLFACGYYE